MSSTSQFLSNPDEVAKLLALRRNIHHPLPVKVSIHPPLPSVTPLSSDARLTITPLTLIQLHKLPRTVAAHEWTQAHYASSDPISHLWVAFYHMIEERSQSQILGHDFHQHHTLFAKLSEMHSRFAAGHTVTLFFSDLFVPDEFPASSTSPHALIRALHILQTTCNDFSSDLFALSSRSICPRQMDASITVTLPNSTAQVTPTRLGCFNVKFTPLVQPHLREQLVTLLHKASMSRFSQSLESLLQQKQQQTNDDTSTAPSSTYHDTFVLSLPVSAILPHASSSQLIRAAAHYHTMAQAVWHVLTCQVQQCLADLIPHTPPFRRLKFLHDHIGPQVTSQFAAMWSTDVPHQALSQLSFAPMPQSTNDTNIESVPIPISAAHLRDVGRLAFDSNQIDPPPMSTHGLRLVSRITNNRATTIPLAMGTVISGRVPDDTIIG